MESTPTWLKLVALTSILAEATAALLLLWRPRRARIARADGTRSGGW
jgi:hypothetical protein